MDGYSYFYDSPSEVVHVACLHISLLRTFHVARGMSPILFRYNLRATQGGSLSFPVVRIAILKPTDILHLSLIEPWDLEYLIMYYVLMFKMHGAHDR